MVSQTDVLKRCLPDSAYGRQKLDFSWLEYRPFFKTHASTANSLECFLETTSRTLFIEYAKPVLKTDIFVSGTAFLYIWVQKVTGLTIEQQDTTFCPVLNI